jgi:GT2 family glycosyltransferase
VHAAPLSGFELLLMQPAVEPILPRDVSVVVPVYRAGEALRACLEHLAAAAPPPGEVIVVGDGEGDGGWRVAGEFGVRVIELPHRVGAAAARNAAGRAAAGKVLMFVDADVAVRPDAVAEVVAALNEHAEWSAVFGSYDDEPGPANFVAQYKGLLNHYVHQHAREEGSTFWTALGAVRKPVFVQLGGFDTGERLEDVEFGYRLRAAGHRVGVRKTLLAKHLKRWTAASLLRSDVFDRALPWTRLMLRHRRAERDLNLDAASRLSVVCVFTLVVALALAWRWPLPCGAAGLVAATGLLWLNRGFYAFVLRKRGVAFLAGAVAWHWLYYLYGGVAFGVGLMLHVLRAGASVPAATAATAATAAATAATPGKALGETEAAR